MLRKLSLISFLLFLVIGARSQDTLVTLVGDKIICIVDDIEDDVVIFQYLNDEVTHGFPTDKLEKIIYADGVIRFFDGGKKIAQIDTLTFIKNHVYRKNVRLKPSNVQSIIYQDAYAFDLYSKGLKKKRWGNALLYTGAFFLASEVSFLLAYGEVAPINWVLWGGMAAGGLALNSKGKRMMQEAIRHYNQQELRGKGVVISLGPTTGGLGLTLNF